MNILQVKLKVLENIKFTKEQWNIQFIFMLDFFPEENQVRSVKECTDKGEYGTNWKKWSLGPQIWQTNHSLNELK